MAVATATALLIAAGTALAGTVYQTEQQKKAAKDASDKQDQQVAKQENEIAGQKKNSEAQDKAVRQRQAAISAQKAAQGGGRDGTILGGGVDLGAAPDMSAVADTLGGSNKGGKSLLGS